MIVARSLQEVTHQKETIVTVGTFDGVHAGHQTILRHVGKRAQELHCRSMVVTFDPHPREVVGRGPVSLLSSLDERVELFSRLGIDETLVLQFTYEFSRQTSREFYEQYVVNGIGVTEVVVGYDHMFGRDREAGVKELEEMGAAIGFAASAVPPVAIDGEIVSSSRIRDDIMRGMVEKAEKMLLRPYSVEGIVVHGDARGKSLGFPTANIRPLFGHKLIPAEGVYCVKVEIGKRSLYGMLNIGVRPTFEAGLKRVIEVHIFDFNETIYDQQIKLLFLKRLRAEKKFASVDDLLAQLKQDQQECRKFIAALQ